MEKEMKPKYITRYGYADGFVRDDRGRPIMINKPCSRKKYEQELKVNWQTAYKYKVMQDGLEYPINKLPNVLRPPVWGKFLKLHIERIEKDFEDRHEYLDLQLAVYNCTYNYVTINKVGSYYFCLKIEKGYRNLSSLKRLL